MNIIRKIKDVYYELRNKIERANKSYCDIDLFNFDSWFLRTIPEMLEKHKNLEEEFIEMDDEFKNDLDRMIFCFKECNEDTCLEINEYDEEYTRTLFGDEDIFDSILVPCEDNPKLYKFNFNEVPKELETNWSNRREQLEKYRDDMKNEAFDLLKKHFWKLWV